MPNWKKSSSSVMSRVTATTSARTCWDACTCQAAKPDSQSPLQVHLTSLFLSNLQRPCACQTADQGCLNRIWLVLSDFQQHQLCLVDDHGDHWPMLKDTTACVICDIDPLDSYANDATQSDAGLVSLRLDQSWQMQDIQAECKARQLCSRQKLNMVMPCMQLLHLSHNQHNWIKDKRKQHNMHCRHAAIAWAPGTVICTWGTYKGMLLIQ